MTLDSGKFYIAWVDGLPSARQTTHLRFVPIYSGYRDDKKELVFTTSYENMYRSLMLDGYSDPVKTSKVAIVVELTDLTSISIFDPKIFDRFNNADAEASE